MLQCQLIYSHKASKFIQKYLDICVFKKKIVTLRAFINYTMYMTRKLIFSTVLAMVAIAMTSCFGPNNEEPTFNEANLLGLWLEEGTEAFVRFTAEQDETSEYKYGRQWDESEDIFESDLKPYGNGWFKYKLVKSDLTEIHLMDNGGAEIPKVYVVVKLTDTELQYKNELGIVTKFEKIVEK